MINIDITIETTTEIDSNVGLSADVVANINVNTTTDADVGIPLILETTHDSLYVSTTGSDTLGDGSEIAPYATITKARNILRTMQPLTLPVKVFLREGLYRESVDFSMLDDSAESITYQSYPGETATVSASELVTGTWSPYFGNIQRITLTGQSNFLSLFVDGLMCTRARYPNEGDYHVAETFPEDSIPDPPLSKTYVYDHFLFDQTYGVPGGIDANTEVVFYDEYIIHRHYYGASDSTEVTFKSGASADVPLNRLVDYGRYFWENALVFLTEPGEWYFDQNTEILYYYPRTGEEDLSDVTVELSTTDSIFTLNGEAVSLPILDEDFTFACNFRSPAVTTTRQGILTTRQLTADSSTAIEVHLTSSGEIRVGYGTTPFTISGTPNLDDDAWHSLAITFNKTTGQVTTYVDETQIDQRIPIVPTSLDTGLPWFGRATAGSQYWNGELNSLLFLDKIVSGATELAELASTARTYSTLSGNIVFSLPLMGDFDVVCDTVIAVTHQEIQGDAYGSLDPYTNDPQFIDGGTGHNPTASFIGSKESDIIGPKDNFVSNSANTTLYPGKQLRNHHFAGLNLVGAARQEPSMTWCVIDSYRNKNIKAAIEAEYLLDCSVTSCTISECGGNGVFLSVSEDCTLSNNTIYNVGGSGLLADAPRYIISERPWGNHSIDNNVIHDVGSILIDACAISTWALPSYTMNYNDIWNIPKVGIKPFQELNAIDFNIGTIEIAYNTIRDTCQKVPDCGAIHTCGYVPNGRVHHNHIKDVLLTSEHTDYRRVGQGTTPYTAIKGIYFDLGSSGWTVDYNKAYRCDAGAMYLLRVGPDMTIENNILVDAANAIYGSYTNTMTGSKFGGDGTIEQYPKGNTVQKNVMYTAEGNAPFKYRFASSDFENSDPGMKPFPFDDTDYNCYYPDDIWHTYDRYSIQNEENLAWLQSTYTSDANSISVDPQFVDYANDDFTVGNAAVFALGFVNFTVRPFIDE